MLNKNSKELQQKTLILFVVIQITKGGIIILKSQDNYTIYVASFEDVETVKEYDGYFYKVTDVITIVLLGSICGLKNISQIHQWPSSDRVKGF